MEVGFGKLVARKNPASGETIMVSQRDIDSWGELNALWTAIALEQRDKFLKELFNSQKMRLLKELY